MQKQVVEKILQLNQEFYQTFAFSFSRTRQRLQPGILMVLNEIPRKGNWLDLGCGNGALAREWALQRRQGIYLGLDFSAELLEEARKNKPEVGLPEGSRIEFQQVDITASGWAGELTTIKWNGILAFAVLHHIPSPDLRLRVLKQVHQLLPKNGRFIFSVWQLQHSPRLLQRCLPWETLGISADQVEEGDTLIDWRADARRKDGGMGTRYVHLFTRAELAELADHAGFSVVEEFESDGRSGNLGLYQIWQK